MAARLVLGLTGDNARLGEIYVSELTSLLGGVERAISRSAAQIAGRPPGTRGRLPQSIAGATKLRLTAIKEGSLVLECALPDTPSNDGSLDLDDERLAESAIRAVIQVLDGSETGFPATAAALSGIAEDLDIGRRHKALSLTQLGAPPRKAVLDADARKRLSDAVQQSTHRDEEGALVGILYEADFEKETAHLRDQVGNSVTVRFEDSHAGEIKEALRERTRLQGSVTYNEATSAVVSVELAKVMPLEQLELIAGGEDFWTSRSLEDLVESQGTSVVDRIEVLRDETISDAEASAYFAALGL